VLRTALALALACYPLLVYFLLDRLAYGYLIIAFGGLLMLRILLMPGLDRTPTALGLCAVAVFCAIALLDQALTLLKLYPLLLNLGAAAYASYTLSHPPSAIERLSVLLGMQIQGPAVVYTRRLTMVWTGFFLLNAAVAAYTALLAPMSTWAWYNGLVSYVLIALLIALEYPVRLWYRKRHEAGPT